MYFILLNLIFIKNKFNKNNFFKNLSYYYNMFSISNLLKSDGKSLDLNKFVNIWDNKSTVKFRKKRFIKQIRSFYKFFWFNEKEGVSNIPKKVKKKIKKICFKKFKFFFFEKNFEKNNISLNSNKFLSFLVYKNFIESNQNDLINYKGDFLVKYSARHNKLFTFNKKKNRKFGKIFLKTTFITDRSFFFDNRVCEYLYNLKIFPFYKGLSLDNLLFIHSKRILCQNFLDKYSIFFKLHVFKIFGKFLKRITYKYKFIKSHRFMHIPNLVEVFDDDIIKGFKRMYGKHKRKLKKLSRVLKNFSPYWKTLNKKSFDFQEDVHYKLTGLFFSFFLENNLIEFSELKLFKFFKYLKIRLFKFSKNRISKFLKIKLFKFHKFKKYKIHKIYELRFFKFIKRNKKHKLRFIRFFAKRKRKYKSRKKVYFFKVKNQIKNKKYKIGSIFLKKFFKENFFILNKQLDNYYYNYSNGLLNSYFYNCFFLKNKQTHLVEATNNTNFINLSCKIRKRVFSKLKVDYIPSFYRYVYYFLSNTIEFILKKKVFLKIFSKSHVNDSVADKLDFIFFRNRRHQSRIGRGFFLHEMLDVLYVTFFYKDLNFLIKWFIKTMYRIDFLNQRKLISALKQIIRRNFVFFLQNNNIIGFFFNVRGKIGVTGNAMSRNIFFCYGDFSKTTKKHKSDYQYEIVKTNTGALGVTMYMTFK